MIMIIIADTKRNGGFSLSMNEVDWDVSWAPCYLKGPQMVDVGISRPVFAPLCLSMINTILLDLSVLSVCEGRKDPAGTPALRIF